VIASQSIRTSFSGLRFQPIEAIAPDLKAPPRM
jgi:hypothetical protein